MGFGSYDESEQRQGGGEDIDEEDAVTVHENDHQGTVEFDTDMSSEELVDQLQDMKGDE